MSDQQRHDAVGYVNPVVKTPNLDKLAQSGITFTQAVCQAPICVPSRYSMMLGLYPSQSGLRFNQQIVPSDDKLPVPVLPQYFQAAGYQTAGFGKTHWYEASMNIPGEETRPSSRGFEHRALCFPRDTFSAEKDAINMYSEFNDTVGSHQEIITAGPGGETVVGYEGKTSAYEGALHREGWATEKALHFLKNDRDPDRLFFLYLSLDFPHPPFNVPPGYEDLYSIDEIPDQVITDDFESLAEHWRFSDTTLQDAWALKSPEERRRTTLRYYALCSYVDSLFGKVIDQLEASGELENTLIVFCSDHGEMLGQRNHRFSKYCLYEGSVRVPLVLAGKGVPSNQCETVDDHSAELIDILPTLLRAAGINTPDFLPGVDLLGDSRKSGSFCEFHGSGYEQEQHGPAYMWRTSEWKIIIYNNINAHESNTNISKVRGELYQLERDPYELSNLYDDPRHLKTREALTRDLLMSIAGNQTRYPRQTTRVPFAC